MLYRSYINYFFVVVSTGATTAAVSVAGATVASGVTTGATAVVSAAGSVLSLELLQATITLVIANNANTFFIFCFVF